MRGMRGRVAHEPPRVRSIDGDGDLDVFFDNRVMYNLGSGSYVAATEHSLLNLRQLVPSSAYELLNIWNAKPAWGDVVRLPPHIISRGARAIARGGRVRLHPWARSCS